MREVADETFAVGPDGRGLSSTTRSLFAETGAGLREYAGQALSFQVMQEWAELGTAPKVAPPLREHARRLMLAPGRPARVRFECLWMRGTAYPRHVADLHRHFRRRVPQLVAEQAIGA